MWSKRRQLPGGALAAGAGERNRKASWGLGGGRVVRFTPVAEEPGSERSCCLPAAPATLSDPRPLLPAVGGGRLLGWTLATPALSSFQTWSTNPRLPHGRGSPGPCPVDRYAPKKTTPKPLTLVFTSPPCAVSGVTVLERVT